MVQPQALATMPPGLNEQPALNANGTNVLLHGQDASSSTRKVGVAPGGAQVHAPGEMPNGPAGPVRDPARKDSSWPRGAARAQRQRHQRSRC